MYLRGKIGATEVFTARIYSTQIASQIFPKAAFQNQSLPSDVTRLICESLPKAKTIHNAPSIQIQRIQGLTNFTSFKTR